MLDMRPRGPFFFYPGARENFENFGMKPTSKSAGLQAELLPLSREQREANNRGPRRRWREDRLRREARTAEAQRRRYRRRRGRKPESSDAQTVIAGLDMRRPGTI